MKLYTEEQVLNALRLAHSHIKPLQYVVDTLTPIELPSDEEIDNELFYQKQVMNPYPTEEYAYTAYEKGFMEAAKWMRDKIRGGNK
jgi:hypothetical protein